MFSIGRAYTGVVLNIWVIDCGRLVTQWCRGYSSLVTVMF
jgi:hypothetical protein